MSGRLNASTHTYGLYGSVTQEKMRSWAGGFPRNVGTGKGDLRLLPLGLHTGGPALHLEEHSEKLEGT